MINKQHDFLVCVDSDGCVFDAMEIKHKECFIPNTINEWNLQAVSKYVREAAEFVNLYSKWRGSNRFPALVKTLELLGERQEARARGFVMPDLTALKKWICEEENLGNPTLEKAIAASDDPILKKTMQWSNAVNACIAKIVRGIPYFPGVPECFDKLCAQADAMIVSATPHEALLREWTEHDLVKYVQIIAGQEMGSKKYCIEQALLDGYARDKVLMVGDALGDLAAARANNVLFYPIMPGQEDQSWHQLYNEAMDKLFDGQYQGDYENKLIATFEFLLPEQPTWLK